MTNMQALALHWSPMIVTALTSKDSMRFGELRRAVPTSDRMLARTLRHLAAAGFVEEDPFDGAYRVTDLGLQVLPLVAIVNGEGAGQGVQSGAPSRALRVGERVVEGKVARPASWDL